MCSLSQFSNGLGKEGINSECDIVNFNAVLDSMMVVYHLKRAVVEDMVSRNGIRYSKSGTRVCGRKQEF